MKSATLHPVPRWCRALVASLIGWLALPGAGFAAATDIANAPLFTSAALTVFPNIMFVLDNSGSMAFPYLPDAAGDFYQAPANQAPFIPVAVGAQSAHCNGLAYDPNTVYTLPVDASGNSVSAPATANLAPDFSLGTTGRTVVGTPTVPSLGPGATVVVSTKNRSDFAAGDFINVYSTNDSTFFAGFVTGTPSFTANKLTVTVDVKMTNGAVGTSVTSAQVSKGTDPYLRYYKYKGAAPDLGFAYTISGSKSTTVANQFYNECALTPGNASTKFDTIPLWQNSPEAQNFANWQTYYSIRIDMMRSSMKLAFKNVTDKYRVGYMTINNGTLAANFLDIGDFSARQKSLFYSKLDNAVAGGGTPLRGALSRAGQYFANKAPGQKSDPMQFACQRNFTILSTDGYWNVAGVETTGYGPYQLDNTTPVGNLDNGTTKPPMSDGSSATTQGNTLADIAMYYYQTDLRNASLNNCTGAPDNKGVRHDVCKDQVPGSAADAHHSFGDTAKWQHMTTFTIGLGVAGFLKYDPDYLTVRSGDFDKIVNGELNWPKPDVTACGGCSPPQNADDLWHAAVNGRGQYFSATEPGSLARGLNAALDSIKAATGAAAAASTSSLQPVAGDNDIFVAQFTTMKWVGDVLAFKIDPDTGNIGTTATWSAQAQLEAKDPTTRTIYYSNGGTTPAMKAFTYANLQADGLNNNFDNFCTKPGVTPGASSPDQCPTLNGKEQKIANDGNNLVAYLRGDQTLSTYYRDRDKRLGDIINASPLFVGKPSFKYADAGYDTFKTNQAARTAVVLAAGNDGMLHAFSRTDGSELWAFMPSFVLPSLYKLADTNYPNNHQFYVDGSPQMGDINVSGTWKTIVVGGLNSGGRGYYALDVTNPASPQLLWEFTNANLGLTYGNPIITKRGGTWVVVFASGYNNSASTGGPSGDGNGHLFVLDAATGALLDDLPTFTSGTTAAGSTANPSGLARINVWVDAESDNTEKRFYGGDLLGNLWRFTIDGTTASGKGALLLAQFTASATAPQAITTKPMLAEVSYNGTKYPVVYVGTGRYLGTSDLTDATVNTIYAIKDPLTTTGWGDIRTRTDIEVRTVTAGTDASSNPTRTVSSGTVDWGSKIGWRANLPGSGERVSVNPQEALDTLYVGTNVPSTDTCEAGGSSFLYQFNINTGNATVSYVDQVLVQGLTIVQLAQGASAGAIEVILTRSDGTVKGTTGSPPPASNVLHRTSWRELVE